jgi:hypothetical protein
MIDRRELLKAASAIAASGAMALIPSRAVAQRVTRLVLVHGRAQEGRDPEVLKAEWMTTLKRGALALNRTVPTDLDVAFPFYGDVLDKYARELDIPLSADMQTRGATPTDREFLQFQAEFAEEVRKRSGITDAQIETEFGDDPQQRGPLNWAWVQATLRAVDKYGGGAGKKTLEIFTRDVFLYVNRPGVRDEIDAIVAAKLTEQPTVVVGHSLGSVVAYSVLRRDTRALKVPIYVTVGCPLAVRSIRDLFRPLRSPKPIAGWYNAFDTRDTVALYPLDATNFPVQPAIDNYGQVKNPTDNHHGIIGYLDNPEVAKHILDGLGA